MVKKKTGAPPEPTPTGNLILMYLTARARLGVEQDYIEKRYLTTAWKLDAGGWLRVVKESNTMGMVTVELTDQARAEYSSPGWTPPTIAALTAEVERLRVENAGLRALARDAL